MIARSKKDINLWMQLSQNGYCILYNMRSAVSTSIRIGNNVAIWFKNHDGSSMDQAKLAFCRSSVHRFDGKAQHQSGHDHSHQCGHYDALPCLHQQPSTKACCGGFSQRQTITWKGCLKELAIELAIEEEQAAKRRKVF